LRFVLIFICLVTLIPTIAVTFLCPHRQRAARCGTSTPRQQTCRIASRHLPLPSPLVSAVLQLLLRLQLQRDVLLLLRRLQL
jgi:hypothetical protein